MGVGLASGSKARIRVRTIRISAPQQAQRIGARGLIHNVARPGSNVNNKCNSVIKRLQFGCKKPKFLARLNPLKPLGQHMLQHPPEELRAGNGTQFALPRLGVAIAKAHLAIVAGDDILLADDAAT